jgi:Cu+-exporting ATPase
MTCQNCARHVAEAIESVAEVAGATVDLNNGMATVKWRGSLRNNQRVQEAVSASGYRAAVAASTAGDTVPRFRGWSLNVVFGSAAMLVLMAGEWIFRAGEQTWFQWLGFALALPVQIFCGARFYRNAWNQLKIGSSNMDTLVALGSTTAFLYSTWGFFAGWQAHLYFMEAVAIITLISIGHWMEAMVGARASSSLHALMALAPETARRLDGSGAEEECRVRDLRPADRVVLRPGERVPTDGKVASGASAVDESMLSGESVPVEKAAGQPVFAGTINVNGRLEIEVTATGEETALAHIIAIVQRAQNSRAEIQKLGDRVSSVFVPCVVAAALAAALAWGFAPAQMRHFATLLEPILWHPHLDGSPLALAIYNAVAILIVACPCAMGLATPAAIMAGTNAAARRGILLRDGGAIERSGKITAVLFDKTGTLTRGELKVDEMLDLREPAGRSAISVTALAATMARPSHHPISRALASLDDGPIVTDSRWRELRGRGIESRHETFGEVPLRLGSTAWLRESGVDFSRASSFTESAGSRGATVLGLAAGESLIGLFALRDTLKPQAAKVLREIEATGKRVYMVSGDQERIARAIGKELGLNPENVFAEIPPERKASIVAELQKRGETLAFVGDGINDAPALEQADLGIAVSRASDVAREAADIILLNSDLEAIPKAMSLAEATLRTIKQNLFWAFFYNAAAIPLAAAGFLSPILCAAAMGLSDVVVIGNALRLRRY